MNVNAKQPGIVCDDRGRVISDETNGTMGYMHMEYPDYLEDYECWCYDNSPDAELMEYFTPQKFQEARDILSAQNNKN